MQWLYFSLPRKLKPENKYNKDTRKMTNIKNKGDNNKMKANKLFSTVGVILIASSMGISGCSIMDKAGKSARKMTSFGSQQSTDTSSIAVNETLIIPPSLKTPASPPAGSRASTPRVAVKKSTSVAKRNYFVIVGTYPDQEKALDTFVRLSSIGLPGATMESRKTKSGKALHMVRLGPYHDQEQIDKITDSLTSDGLSQFKVVEN
ncbi:MAG TPA: hypothetical protein EYH38_03340 [Leucothrix sp.]|nr:hypothetical protein [Leucothrix sp.]